MALLRVLAAVLASLSAQAAAPVVPPPDAAARERVAVEMLRLARVDANDSVYDLGSGGTVAAVAARQFGARAVTAFAEASVVALDLTPAQNLRLEPVLRELRPGTRIVSHRFGIGAWRADDSAKASDATTIFLWTVPRRPARIPDIFFVPTGQRVVEQMLELAAVSSSDVVCDLGSGDGRIVVIAALNYGARGIGVELDPALVKRAQSVARDAQISDRARFIEGDLFDADLSEVTVVTLFLSDAVNRRLEAKLKRELKPGTRVVSRQFRIGDWEPDRIMTAADGTSLFLWTIR